MKRVMLILGLLVADQALCLDSLSVLRMSRQIYAPRVDRPFEWKRIPSQSGFVKTILPYVPEERTTIVRAAHDAANLYVRLEMKEPLESELVGREKFTIWENAYVELMVETPETRSRRAHLHLSVDCLGRTHFAEEHESTEMPGTYVSKPSNLKGLCAAVERIPGGWAAVFTVPAGSFSGRWPVNFCRQHREPYGFSSWSHTKVFSDRKRFGAVVFDAGADNGATYEKALKDFQDERSLVFGKFKEKSYPFKWAWGTAPGYRALDARYKAARGYGWMNAVTAGKTSKNFLEKRRRPSPLSDLADNYVGGTEANVFRIDLPNGDYNVHVLCGFFGGRHEFALEANGAKVMDFAVGGKHFEMWDFPVSVRGGRLDLRFVPKDVVDNPVTAAYAKSSKFYQKGFCVNSIVVVPKAERKAAAAQIARDELEIRVFCVDELANREVVVPRDPEPSFAPTTAAQKRGWTVFTRPLGENIYAGSRPRSREEQTDILKVCAAPGERFYVSFGVLPLRDADGRSWTSRGFPLRIREAQQMPWVAGDGKYAFCPYQLEEADYVDHDLDRGVTRNLWLSGKVPAGAKPGVIRAAFAIGKDSVPVEIEVLPFVLDETDFAWGGYHPDGYGRPECYEDRVAQACADVGMSAFVFYAQPEKYQPGSFARLKERIKLYEATGMKGRYGVYCQMHGETDHALMKKRIPSLPQWAIDDQIALARSIVTLHGLPRHPEIYYTSMDEAHCKGEPYWSEQIRLFKAIKEAVPGLLTCGSESERSYRRSAAYMDVPILFEVPDFTQVVGVKKVWSYPNQAMLDGDNANAGRYCCGIFPFLTSVKAVVPWQVMRERDNSPLRAGPWELVTARGTGGYRVIPRTVAALADVGTFDLRYLVTLRRLTAEAKKGDATARAAGARAQLLLDMIAESVRPSYMHYLHNGHLPAEAFCALREKTIDAILALRAEGVR